MSLSNNFKRAKECILEIAKLLDESRICPRDQICRHIKEILADKIKEGKITDRWIDESLPKEYKREYRKREASSLSQKNAGTEHSGAMDLVLLPRQANKNGTGQDAAQIQNNIDKDTESKTCTSEHTVSISGDGQLNEQIKFTINKHQKDLINKGLENCRQFCWVTFSKSGELNGVTTDRSVEMQ